DGKTENLFHSTFTFNKLGDKNAMGCLLSHTATKICLNSCSAKNFNIFFRFRLKYSIKCSASGGNVLKTC
ncbi:MAG: hypothetical protein II801_04840, partial [Bacteroidaceae bacterium]|nr:hypothetical protein [Bacteroidaceae bacterium]